MTAFSHSMRVAMWVDLTHMATTKPHSIECGEKLETGGIHRNQPELQWGHWPGASGVSKPEPSSYTPEFGARCFSGWFRWILKGGQQICGNELHPCELCVTVTTTMQPLEIPRAAIGTRGRVVECSRLLIGQTGQGHEGSNPSASASFKKDSTTSRKRKAKLK